MSGPALRQPDTHRAIHDVALTEARLALEAVRNLVATGRITEAIPAAEVFLEVFEGRVLRHASAEEEPGGLYAGAKDADDGLGGAIAELTREHDGLRALHAVIASQLASRAPDERTVALMEALLDADERHNSHEEELLFRADEARAADGARPRRTFS